jgi:CRP-like cAMP-binding protein
VIVDAFLARGDRVVTSAAGRRPGPRTDSGPRLPTSAIRTRWRPSGSDSTTNPDGIRLEFPLTHDLLAEMVASARETVTRAFDELQRSGFVIRDGHSYTLLVSPEVLDAPG